MEEEIKQYLSILNKNLNHIDNDIIDFTIDETLDRVKVYLNTDTIKEGLTRIIAKIVNTGLTKAVKEAEMSQAGDMSADKAVASISDNGQSISYSNEITRYFTNVTDEELFTGFHSLLSRYRRIKVVHPEKHEE